MEGGEKVGIGGHIGEHRADGVHHPRMKLQAVGLEIFSLEAGKPLWREATKDDIVELAGKEGDSGTPLRGITEINEDDIEGLFGLFEIATAVPDMELHACVLVRTGAPPGEAAATHLNEFSV